MQKNKMKNKALKYQLLFLKIYSFFWWAFFSMVFVFQSVYFAEIGISLNKIFINSAVAVIFSLFIVNLWSKISDKTHKKKKFIIVGNLMRCISFAFLPFVNSFPTMLIYTIIFNSGPHPDAILITYIYKISSFTDSEQSQKRPIYHKIYTYANIRKFGSIGWAAMLPFSGLIVDFFGFQVNFLVSAVCLAIMTLIFTIIFDETIIVKLANEDEKMADEKSNLHNFTLLTNLKNILKNQMYRIFILIVFVVAISGAMNTTVFSIFNFKFSNDSYFLLSLTWSFNAALEYPIMLLAPKLIERYKWQNVMVITYILGTIRHLLNPLVIIFDGTIVWIYFFQIINGFTFGLGWPATTYGINSNLDEDQKSLGMTFYNSIKLMGNFIGNLIGSIIASLIANENIFYYILYTISALISLIAAIAFGLKAKKLRKRKDINEK
ncbi:MAG: MFS transporter [Candidatus Lokiarchaeota archaeon]|nr:MFS transporter [Candidatus Lokiarchaeota archaeon]